MSVISNNINIRETKAVEKPETRISQGSANSFNKVLSDAITRQEPVQFSRHAHNRLNNRKITLTSEQLNRVESGLNAANAKGIRDSLVLVDNVALVVNVKSKTVITALERGQENVFSNIDGAVIV
jgi:flagellar operon protein